MMLAIDPAATTAIGVVLAALISAAVAFWAASRRFSGKIAQTDAEQLWDEAHKLRDEYRLSRDEAIKRLVDGERRSAEVEKRMAEVERRNTDLEREALAQERRFHDCQDTIRELRAQLEGKAG